LVSITIPSYHTLSQKDYLAQDSETLDPDYIREFLFLVKHKAFYRGLVHFMGSELNDKQAEELAQGIRGMGWNATRRKVRVLEAVRSHDIISNDGQYGLCRILKIDDPDDSVDNYRSVINLRKGSTYTRHEMFALPPEPGFWFYFCNNNYDRWEINVVKLDMRGGSIKYSTLTM
jgi:hypothetical protein